VYIGLQLRGVNNMNAVLNAKYISITVMSLGLCYINVALIIAYMNKFSLR